eukprot:TRINITY_DN988_c0_g1_i2.p1 TRINITY_DN988_c0_g1~~TRINITY_DN988_c0_g1_i2.p1  ORF type:complete len:294 (-),score=81.38 TRINITY_DN988_c0_g1_i2:111-992(-)
MGLLFPILDPSLEADLRDMFDLIDLDRDGTLSVKEVVLYQLFVTQCLQWGRVWQPGKADMLFTLLDEDNSGTLEWQEVEPFANKFGMEDWKTGFSGKAVTRAEFTRIVESQGSYTSSAVAPAAAADTTAAVAVSSNKRAKQLAQANNMADITAAFDRLNTDVLGPHDFGLILFLIDPSLKQRALNLFHLVDSDGSGSLSLEEVLAFKSLGSIVSLRRPSATAPAPAAGTSPTAATASRLAELLAAIGGGVVRWADVAKHAQWFGIADDLQLRVFKGRGAITSAEFASAATLLF